MKLTEQEKAILDGREGPVKQQAMRFLMEYGEAVGADCLVDTDDVTYTVACPYPTYANANIEFDTIEHLFSWADLGCEEDELFDEIPDVCMKRTCTLCGIDVMPEYVDYLGITGEEARKLKDGAARCHEFIRSHGTNDVMCCAPEIVGHVLSKGEHSVTGESSQVVFQNSFSGARANCEGLAVTGAAAMVGKVPNIGYHLDENRWGTHLIKVDCIPQSVFDWDVLGYWTGHRIGVGVPVFDVDVPSVSMDCHKSLGAAICTGGQVDLYHILGLTPEAGTYDLAFGKNRPSEIIHYTEKEREEALAELDWAMIEDVDLVILGCPQYSIFQLKEAAEYLEGKHCKAKLIIQTPRLLIDQARTNGDAQKIEEAGGFLLADSCVPMLRMWPEGLKCLATDSAKSAKYIPGDRPDVEVHMGDMEKCLRAAVTGKWSE